MRKSPRKEMVLLPWPWTLTYDPVLQTSSRHDQDESASQIHRSKVISFRSYRLKVVVRTHRQRPIALSGRKVVGNYQITSASIVTMANSNISRWPPCRHHSSLHSLNQFQPRVPLIFLLIRWHVDKTASFIAWLKLNDITGKPLTGIQTSAVGPLDSYGNGNVNFFFTWEREREWSFGEWEGTGMLLSLKFLVY